MRTPNFTKHCSGSFCSAVNNLLLFHNYSAPFADLAFWTVKTKNFPRTEREPISNERSFIFEYKNSTHYWVKFLILCLSQMSELQGCLIFFLLGHEIAPADYYLWGAIFLKKLQSNLKSARFSYLKFYNINRFFQFKRTTFIVFVSGRFSVFERSRYFVFKI